MGWADLVQPLFVEWRHELGSRALPFRMVCLCLMAIVAHSGPFLPLCRTSVYAGGSCTYAACLHGPPERDRGQKLKTVYVRPFHQFGTQDLTMDNIFY